MSSFTSLFRFRDDQGSVYYGEAGADGKFTKESLTGREVQIFTGDNPWDDDFKLSNERRKVAEVCVQHHFIANVYTKLRPGSLPPATHSYFLLCRLKLQTTCR